MPKRILLVEDEQMISETLTDLLRPGGYTVKSTTNGHKAMDMLRLYRPHLIISDIMMPGMDGIELLSQLKSSPDWNDIPVILLTAKRQAEDRIAGLRTGADAYIAKPFNFHELVLTVHNLLKLKANILKGSFLHQQELDEAADENLFAKKVSEFLAAHFAESDLPLSVLADHFGLSASGFKKKLKKATGKTVQEFVREFRLKKAMEYLSTYSYNVSQVALMTGFKSNAHFSDAFKKHFGISPSGVLA